MESNETRNQFVSLLADNSAAIWFGTNSSLATITSSIFANLVALGAGRTLATINPSIGFSKSVSLLAQYKRALDQWTRKNGLARTQLDTIGTSWALSTMNPLESHLANVSLGTQYLSASKLGTWSSLVIAFDMTSSSPILASSDTLGSTSLAPSTMVSVSRIHQSFILFTFGNVEASENGTLGFATPYSSLSISASLYTSGTALAQSTKWTFENRILEFVTTLAWFGERTFDVRAVWKSFTFSKPRIRRTKRHGLFLCHAAIRQQGS